LKRLLIIDALFKEDLDQTALEQKILQDVTPYLVSEIDTTQSPLQEQINALENDPEKDAASQLKIDEKKARLSEYKNNYLAGVATYQQSHAEMQALDNNNSIFSKVFLPPPEKQHEYRYIIDTETCKYLCHEHDLAEDTTLTFSLPDTIELKDNQTDAVRVWQHNINVENLTIRDFRDDIESAHRDGIQLIPPPSYRKTTIDGKETLVKQADQMVGTILNNVTISYCDILAPTAALQGIFSSDGMCKNLKISHVSVGTHGGHAISISGVLSGCEISHVTLHQQAGSVAPEIALYPFRIGGNMADDGMVYILGFKEGTGYNYDPIIQTGNKRYLTGQSQPEDITVSDYRGKIPDKFVRFTLGLKDFDYPGYFRDYTTWTLADFKQNMSTEYQQMKEWVKRRYKEYSTGVRTPEADRIDGKLFELPNISPEQKDPKEFGIRYMLNEARKLLASEDSTRMNMRLPELQETAIRSFAMKCIAIKHGKPEPLYNLGRTLNIHRKAYLHYLMPASYFADENLNDTNNPYRHLFEHQSNTTTQKPENGKTPKAGDAYSSDADKELAKAVRIAPDLSISQGKPIAFYFDFNDNSKYRQGYTFKWSVLENNTVTPKEGAETYYSISSKALALGDNRVNCTVSKAGEKTERVIIRFNVTEAEEPTDSAQTATNQTKPVAPKASEIWSLPKDNELKAALRVAPSLSVPQGEDIQLSLASPFNNDAAYSYKWTAVNTDLAIGKNNSYTIKTTDLAVKDKYRIFCDVTKDGHMQRVIAYYNVKEKSVQIAETTKPKAVTPEGTWSRTPSLKEDLRITPSQALAKGEKIKFFFREGSKYNDGSYTFRWSISGHANLGTGRGKSRTIDTGKLDKGEYRLVFTVTDKNGTAYNGSVNFTVLAAQAATGAQDTTSTASKETVPTPTTKSWGALANKIMVTPSPVQQGDKATFTIDTRSFKPETSTLSYYWSFNGKTGRGASFEVDTTDLATGEHKLSVTLYTKAQGETKRTSIPGGVLFTVVKKTTTTAPLASTGATTEKPAKIGGDLGQYIRVTEKTIEKGKTITFSLDPAFIEQEEQNAKLTYYWLLPGHKAGRKSSYAIDTTALDKGSHRVQVAMYKTPNGGTRVASNGWGMFEVVASSTTKTKGVINIQIMNQATNSPESSIRYSLISNSDSTWIHQDKTDSKGKIKLEDIPVGQYTLRLDEPEVDIVTVESNQENQ